MMNNGADIQMVTQDIEADNTIISELEGIWRRTSDSSDIEALFQVLKAELQSNVEESQQFNTYSNKDQLAYLNSDEINDELLEEIFGAETQENDCIFQNEAPIEEVQAVLRDFDCSVFEYKPVVEVINNNECFRDPETQVSVEIYKEH